MYGTLLYRGYEDVQIYDLDIIFDLIFTVLFWGMSLSIFWFFNVSG